MDTQALSPNTVLNDRVLWFDGDSAFDPANLIQSVSKFDVHHVTHDDEKVREYNKHVSRGQEIDVKRECMPLRTDWVIPDEYKTLNVVEYLTTKHIQLTKNMSPTEANARDIRLVQELVKYDAFGLTDVLRAIIWTINMLTTNNIVWGVGRGSSVSSYVLYVIGVHDVDSFAYDLDVDDFLHE